MNDFPRPSTIEQYDHQKYSYRLGDVTGSIVIPYVIAEDGLRACSQEYALMWLANRDAERIAGLAVVVKEETE